MVSKLLFLRFALCQADALFVDKLVHLRDLPVVVGGKFFYLLFVSGFGFRKMVCQFLNLPFVSGFGLRKMVCQLLNLLFVSGFGFRKMVWQFFDLIFVACLCL